MNQWGGWAENMNKDGVNRTTVRPDTAVQAHLQSLAPKS